MLSVFIFLGEYIAAFYLSLYNIMAPEFYLWIITVRAVLPINIIV